MCLFSVGIPVLLLFFAVKFTIILLGKCDALLALAVRWGKRIDSLRGKVIWVTGASSGIGEELAIVLAENGAKVVLSARREAELQRVAKRCIDEGKCAPDNVFVLPMDVVQLDKHQELFDKVLEKFGTLDILVNNAGRSQRANWEDISIAVDKQLFELNVFGVLSLSRIAVKYFLARGGGHVAVMSSLAGVVGVSHSGSYTGAKHAIHGYFNGLRTEKAGNNIDVTLLCPGPVVSNVLAESFTAKEGEKYNEQQILSPYRMETRDCSELCAVALANKLAEVWIGRSFVIVLVYFATSFPNLFNLFTHIVGQRLFLKIRDNKDELKKEN